jgi:phosphohistidine phosphatase
MFMKTLLVLRHAKSSWKNANLADFDRPLNKRGKRDAPRMGELLRREGIVPDLIISSSAERALTTAEAVALACGYDLEIQTTRQLYHAWPDDYIEGAEYGINRGAGPNLATQGTDLGRDRLPP